MLNNLAIFEILFDRNFSDRENITFLKDITEKHPYFTPAQFYLLLLTENGTEQFNSLVNKTNILFNNPHWLNFQLQQTGREVITPKEFDAIEKFDGVIGVHVVDEVKKVEVVYKDGEVDMVNGMEAVEEVYEAAKVGVVNGVDNMEEVEKVARVDDVVDVFEAKVVDEDDEVKNASGGIGVDDMEEVEKVGGVEKVSVNDDVKAADEVPEPGYEQAKETYPEKSIVQSRDHLADEPDATEEENGYQQEPELEPMKIELKMPEQKASLDEAMLFEPMHIVDYFASQGIKLTDVVQPGDKLGKQLKSFTEWLKTMKKVHIENEATASADTGTVIQTLAEISNINMEVLTESMAEVFVKQGKTAKAGELYQKLSLLNPAKSAYFAAKIENLKEI